MNEQKNIETVKEMYAAFGRGDVDYIVNQVADDVSWNSHFAKEVPWGGDMSGKTNVPKFFEAIYTNVDVLGFEPKEFIAQGDSVVCTGTFEATSKTTGKSALTPWVFIWKFKDGKVESYEQFADADFASIFVA